MGAAMLRSHDLLCHAIKKNCESSKIGTLSLNGYTWHTQTILI